MNKKGFTPILVLLAAILVVGIAGYYWYSKTRKTPIATNQTTNTAGSAVPSQTSGWITVPGNPTFGTKDFSVMKYDAKCADSNGTPLTSPDTVDFHTYDSYSQPCVSPYHVVSAPTGYPIANMFHTDAVTYCSDIGAHLITNNEWMTIADNVAGVSSNWSGGSVGSGYLYSGHNDDAPNNALQASPDDTQGYYHTDGPVSGGGTGTGGTAARNQRRTLTLSNGNVIWDLAGNIVEWTNNTITGKNEPHGSTSGWNMYEFPNVTNWGTMSRETVAPTNPAWSSSQGVGILESENDNSDTTTYPFLRGDDWVSGSGAGAFTLLLGWDSPGVKVGFRCAR